MKSILQYMGWRKIALDAMKRDGIVIMPPLAPEQIEEVVKHCRKHDVITAPWLFEVYLSTYDIAKNYFRREPSLVSLEKEVASPDITTKWWNAFGTDAREIKMVIYGSDVSVSGDGAFVYNPTSHRTLATGSYPDTVIGPAGTCFLFDPAGCHIHIRPAKEQLLFVGRWVADVDSSVGKNAPPGFLAPFSREVLGSRYPRNKILQKAVEYVVR